MSKTKIIILGGSYSGVKAGKTLHKAFKKNPNIEITLIDKHDFHTLMTELHEVAGHRVESESIKINLHKIFAGRKVNIIIDEITGFDFEKKKLISENATYYFDYLIMGLGNEPNFFGIEGADKYSHTLWSYEDAVVLKKHIESMFAKASIEPNPQERQKLLTFAVCGGGFTGVEMAGELGEAKVHLSKKYGINPKEIKIYNIEATNRILNMLKSDKQVNQVEKRYKKLGIKLLKDSPITKIDKDSFILKNGTTIPTYTLIWTAGIKNNSLATNMGFELGKGERIVVNEFMQPKINNKIIKNIFIVGDSASYIDEEVGQMPQIVEAAEQSGYTAATNIISLITGQNLHKHKQNYHGFMVSVGSRYAVADTGFKSSGWFAQLIKHFVNFYYQFMVCGLNQLWSYLRHEFFHIKNRRSFVGGYFSKSSKNIWRLPLRLWLGYMWLVEGVAKIAEGWLNKPMVVNTINTIANYSTGKANTITTASPDTSVVTEGNAEAVSQLPSFIQWAIDHKPTGYGEAIMHAPKFMLDIMNKWISPIEVPVQTLMVLAEIIIGLCLIIGLFTFISSIASVAIGIGITFTGMADATMLWYIFSGIALIEGSGSTFGVDYYIIPRLKEWWSNTKFAKKSYFYFNYHNES